MKIVKSERVNLKEIINAVKKGKVIVFPTDTVYGLITEAGNKKAVEKIFKIKNRPKNKPFPIFVKDINSAKRLAEIDRNQEKFLKSVWPGKVTVILKRRNNGLKLYGVKKETIGIRIPKYKLLNILLEKINRPLVQTSTNISGSPPLNSIQEIIKAFRNRKYKPDLVVDIGKSLPGKQSRIIDLSGEKIKVIRK